MPVNINSVYYDFLDQPGREFVMYGGSGAGKSYAIIQFLIYKLVFSEESVRILMARKWMATLRNTVLTDVLKVLQEFGILSSVDYNKTTSTITYGTNRIDMMGLDNPEKIKGANYNYIWLEETTDFDIEDYRQLRLRLGRSKENKQAKFIFSFNPIDSEHFTWQDLVCTEKEGRHVKLVTYLDNRKYLNREWIQQLEALKEEDENYYNIYVLGKPGVIKNVIYDKYKIGTYRLTPQQYDVVGIDFGFNNPTAVIAIHKSDTGYIINELMYESKRTNNDLIKALKLLLKDKPKVPIYCDSAEPDRIEELKRAGFVARPAKKDVTAGIDACKREWLLVDGGSEHVIKELKTYKYKEDKYEHVLEEPLKFNDHAMDAMRYAIYSMWGNRRLANIKYISGGGSSTIELQAFGDDDYDEDY